MGWRVLEVKTGEIRAKAPRVPMGKERIACGVQGLEEVDMLGRCKTVAVVPGF